MKRALLTSTLLVGVSTAFAQTVTPGSESITVNGHTWLITASGSIQEDGAWTPGGGGTSALTGGGTSALTIGTDGTVYGQDNGHDGNTVNSGGWFTLSADGQSWSKSDPPNTTTSTAVNVPSAPATPTTGQTVAPTVPYTVACTATVPHAAPSTGGFGTLDGQFYDPSGKPWIAHGVNVPDFSMDQAQSTLLSLLPNTNFIRLNVYSYADPSKYQSFINWATARGIVVEIDDHVSFPSDAFSGGALTAETQWVSAMAAANKTNPYVWFETQNEPQSGDITGEETAFYNAVRNAGNNNPIGLQLYGGGNPGFLDKMNLSAYTSMTNVFIAPHFYDWLAKYSTDPVAIAAALQGEIAQAQQIKTADGTPPILIDEFGDSTDGSNIDGGGPATVNAVLQSGYGSAAWNFMNPGGSSDPADQVTNSGQSLTAMGSQIASTMTTPATGCAQSTTPTLTATETAPPLAPASTAQTAPDLASGAADVTAPPLAANNLSVGQVAVMAAAP